MHKKGSVGLGGSSGAEEAEISPFLTMLIVKVMKGETDLMVNCDTSTQRVRFRASFTSVSFIHTHTHNLA